MNFMDYRKMRKPSCYDCVHSEIIEGARGSFYDPEVPDEAQCMNKEIGEQWNEKYEKIFEEVGFDEDKLPSKCGYFKPIIIGKCSLESCQKEMNVPEYNWPYWATEHLAHAVPVCSEECKTAIEVMEKLIRSIDKDEDEDDLIGF